MPEESYPTAAALVQARAMKRVAGKYGDLNLARRAKALEKDAKEALAKRQSVLSAPQKKNSETRLRGSPARRRQTRATASHSWCGEAKVRPKWRNGARRSHWAHGCRKRCREDCLATYSGKRNYSRKRRPNWWRLPPEERVRRASQVAKKAWRT